MPTGSSHVLTFMFHNASGGCTDAVVNAALLGKSEIVGSSPRLAFRFQGNKCFFSDREVTLFCLYFFHLLINIQFLETNNHQRFFFFGGGVSPRLAYMCTKKV